MISDQEFASSPPRSSDFFACGILPAANPFFACGTFSPPQGYKPRTKRSRCLFISWPAPQSIYQPEQPAHSTAVSSISSRCPCSRRSSQPQPATTSQRCCQQQAGSTAGAALQMHASRIRSCAHQPHWLNQLANNRRSPPCCAQDKPRRPCCLLRIEYNARFG